LLSKLSVKKESVIEDNRKVQSRLRCLGDQRLMPKLEKELKVRLRFFASIASIPSSRLLNRVWVAFLFSPTNHRGLSLDSTSDLYPYRR